MYYRRIIQLLTPPEKKRFYWILFSMIVFSFFESLGFSLIIPYVGIINNRDETLSWIEAHFRIVLTESELIFLISGLFLAFITIKFLLQIYVSLQSSRFPYEFYKDKSKRNYRQYMTQPYLEYLKGGTGSFIKNCTNTVEHSANALVVYLRYLSALVTTLFLFGLILLENFIISGTFIILFSSIGFVIHKLSKRPQLRAGKEKEHNFTKLFQWISDSFIVFKEVKLYGKKNRFFAIFNKWIDGLAKAYEDSVFYPTLPPIYMEYFAIIVLLVVISVYISRGYPISSLVAPLLFYGVVGRRLLPSLTLTVSQRIQMQHFIPALECLDAELKKPVVQHTDSEHAIHFQNDLKFSNIYFSYKPNAEILKGIDFEIEKNKSIAIVGPSGAGKSTIVKILTGLIRPDAGKIIIDGKEYENLESLTHLVGYVPQDIALMAGSILDNITLFEETPDFEQLERAVAMSQLQDFIISIPEGLHTAVGEKGMNLSGGQKQRIGIARALYQKPEILLFDEATSSLDTLSESLITETIRNMSGKKTIIAIAHRLTTIQNFDKIYVLEGGRIIGQGTHRELIESCLLYKCLTS